MPIHTPAQSNFEALIEDLFTQTDPHDEAPKAAHPFSLDSLEAAWELASSARAMPKSSASKHDARFALPTRGYDASDVALDVSLDPAKIIGELGLRPEASEADIIALRREFALRNHPDRVPAELREIATQRMMIANDLIDRHVAKLRKRGA